MALLALALGGAWAIALATELAAPLRDGSHHDFLAFYGAGRLILTGDPAGIYDAAALTSIQRTIVPGTVGMNGYMPFINPPFAAVAFAPLAALPAEAARAVWAAINVALLGAAAVAIAWQPSARQPSAWQASATPSSPRDRSLAAILIATSFPAYHALAEGQWSILLLAAGIGALAAGRRGRWGLVGLALVPFWLKPQLIVLPVLALVLTRRWRAVAVACGGGAALLVLSIPFTGIGPYARYLGYLTDVVTSHFTGAGAIQATTWRGDLASTEGLNGLLVGYLGQGSTGLVNVLWLIGAGVLVALYGLAVRRRHPGFETPAARAMLATGILVTLLVNPNLFAQDCVLAFLALASLWPLPRQFVLPATALAVGLADLIALDQGALTLHLFTIGLVALVVLVAGRAVLLAPSQAVGSRGGAG